MAGFRPSRPTRLVLTYVRFRGIAEVDRRALLADRDANGRVEVWRGGFRSNISVSASFVWRCLSGSTMTPFPHPAHRTGHADFPHPALGQKRHAFAHDTSRPSALRRTSPKCP